MAVETLDSSPEVKRANANPLFRNTVLPLAVTLLIVLLALPILTYPLGRDQGEFATIARGLLNGKTPYVDLWNPKPPAVFYVYALAIRLFGQTAEAVRAIDLIIAPPMLLSVYWIATRIVESQRNTARGQHDDGESGNASLRPSARPSVRFPLFAVVLFGVSYFTETFWTLTQNDGIVLLPMLLAMVSMFKAAESGREAPLWALAAGGLCALVVWFKYPFVLFVAALAGGYIAIQRKSARREGRTDNVKVSASFRFSAFAFLSGLVVVGGGAALALASIGAWDALVQSATVTAGYTALSFEPREFLSTMALASQYRLAHWGLPFGLAVVGALALLRTRAIDLHWLPILLWFGAGLAIMLAQGKGYDYHWLPMLPPLAILAGFGLDQGIVFILKYTSFHKSKRVVDGLVAVGLLLILTVVVWSRALPYLMGAEDRSAYFGHFQAGEFVADESLGVAEFLRQRVVPGDSLFIWGFRPEVYYLSQLNPAVRFIFHFPLVADWYPQEWREETVDILWAALPPYVLVLQADYMPWVTGSHDDSHTLLQQYEELNDWLVYNYQRDAQIGNFLIWRRTS